MATTLEVVVDEHTEINLIDIVSGGFTETVEQGFNPYNDWSTSYEVYGTTSPVTHTHTIGAVDDNPNFLVVTMHRQAGSHSPNTADVEADGVAMTLIGKTVNGWFGTNLAGLAMYALVHPTGGQWEDSIEITFTETDATSASSMGVMSGYANTQEPAILDTGSELWVAGNNTFNFDAGSDLGVPVFITHATGSAATGDMPTIQLNDTSGHMHVVSDPFTGADDFTINGGAGSSGIFVIMGDAGAPRLITDTVTMTIPDEGWVKQDELKVTVERA